MRGSYPPVPGAAPGSATTLLYLGAIAAWSIYKGRRYIKLVNTRLSVLAVGKPLIEENIMTYVLCIVIGLAAGYIVARIYDKKKVK